MTIGEKIRERREVLGLSLMEVERSSGVQRASICRYERGTSTPVFGAAQRLAKALGFSLDGLDEGRRCRGMVDSDYLRAIKLSRAKVVIDPDLTSVSLSYLPVGFKP